jgi:hypothetical protein
MDKLYCSLIRKIILWEVKIEKKRKIVLDGHAIGQLAAIKPELPFLGIQMAASGSMVHHTVKGFLSMKMHFSTVQCFVRFQMPGGSGGGGS